MDTSTLERALKSPPISPLTIVGNAFSNELEEEGTTASSTATTTAATGTVLGDGSSTSSDGKKATVRVALVDTNVSMDDVGSVQFVCAKTNKVLGCRRLSASP